MQNYEKICNFVCSKACDVKIKLKRVKIHHEGVLLLILLFVVLAALNVPLWIFLPAPLPVPVVLSCISIACYAFVFNFFRSPKRVYHGERENCVVSSADGRVVVAERTFEPEFLQSEAIQVSVFMSPLNVHANWFPVDGEVVYVKHHSGRFLSAWLPKSSTENERSTIGIITESGHRITVRQVAGALARRIVTYAEPGVEANIQDHLGFIKFGSRVDIYLPVDSEIMVKLDDYVSGGVTRIARLPGLST